MKHPPLSKILTKFSPSAAPEMIHLELGSQEVSSLILGMFKSELHIHLMESVSWRVNRAGARVGQKRHQGGTV